VPTDKKFTGQRLDNSGLYYYGARYYDAGIGRFISSDTIVPEPFNPQSLNRYSYTLNNPLKYTDPSGHLVEFGPGGAEYDVAGIVTLFGWLFVTGSLPTSFIGDAGLAEAYTDARFAAGEASVPVFGEEEMK